MSGVARKRDRLPLRRAGAPLLLLVALHLTGCGATRVAEQSPIKPPASNLTPPQQPLAVDVPGVPNFGFVTHDLWRGAQPSPEGFAKLAELGVKTVIDLRLSDTPPDVVPPGVHVVHLPVSAWRANGVDPWKLLHLIHTSPTPIFIHCREGRDRTGLAVAEYRLSKGMNPADACRELVSFHVNLWWELPIERRIFQLAPLLRPTASNP